MSEWYGLTRLDGPECDRCGCRDVTTLQQAQTGVVWVKTGRARCRHCGRLFAFRNTAECEQSLEIENPTVEIQASQPPTVSIQQTSPLTTRVDVMQPTIGIATDATACPTCGGKGLVKSTQGKTQYRQCKECGERYKTQKVAS